MFSRPPVKFTGPEQDNNIARVDALFSQRNVKPEIEVKRIAKKTVPSAKYEKEILMPGLVSTRRCATGPRLSFSNGPMAIPRSTQSKESFMRDLLAPQRKVIPATTITSDRTIESIDERTLITESLHAPAIEEDDISPYNSYEVCSTFYPPNPHLVAAAYRGHELIKSVPKSTELVLTSVPLPVISGVVDPSVYRQIIAIYEHNQQFLLDTNGAIQYYQQLENWFLHIVDAPVKRREWILEQKFKLANGYSTICRVECRALAQTFSASLFISSLIP